MADHTAIRLETLSGDVLAYFAPNAETTRSFDNDLTAQALPEQDASPLVLDFGQWTAEITLQGFFETTESLPDAHATAVETLVGKSPATAKDQLNYLISNTVFGGDGGPYALYDEGDEYTATTNAGVDVANDIYPAVSIEQIQPSVNSGETRQSYTVKFRPGVEG
ncbi:hypothetical protein HRTV-28_gp36 [Halorubrum tailed virus 28]|uniref:Uncharacterized protein n=1 Tax=Halorubrum tailed virus 28 TaxID=2878009 RepID=A0AAE8Y0B3_9CAUD|nr:hypothetical protein M1M39_gp37 [Halorubrum tailed virus 28]UBF23474.1 hypothetical protein HRTV-28_gp36 [Halorubrum tailed virus 28]